MASLLNELLNIVLSSGGTKALSQKTGASNDQLTDVISSVMPLLLQSMATNASDEKGSASLEKALAEHAKVTDSAEDQLANADLEDGAKILAHLLGKKQTTVEKTVAKESGLDVSQVTTILAALAPLLLNQVGQQTATATKTTKTTAKTTKTTAKTEATTTGDLLGTVLTGMLSGGSNSKTSSGGLADLLINLVTGK